MTDETSDVSHDCAQNPKVNRPGTDLIKAADAFSASLNF